MKTKKKDVKGSGRDYSLDYLKLYASFLKMWDATKEEKGDKAIGYLEKLTTDVYKLIDKE